MSTLVQMVKNTAPPMEEVWVFVSRDELGRENVIGSLAGEFGMRPLMTGNPRVLELFKPLAAEVARAVRGTGQSIHLLRFSNREETEWMP